MAELAFICLGSNVEPERHLAAALGRLRKVGRLVAVSPVYQSAAVGPRPAPDFLNAAALVETEREPLDIRAVLRRIEAGLGRVRSADRYAPRTIDLDLCLLGDRTLSEEGLTLPDPAVLERAYLARVLADLDPAFPYPGRGEPLGEIARRLAPGSRLVPRPDVLLSP